MTVRFSKIALVVLSVVVGASFTSSARDGSAAVKITAPPNIKVEVGKTYKVEGVASLPRDAHVWVFARREDFQGVWYPQGEGKVNPVTGQWKVHVTFGTQDDVGWDFDVAAVVVAQREHLILADYRIQAMRSGEWRPVRLPSLLAVPALIRVVKTHD